MKFVQLGRKYQKVALTREGMHYWAIDMDGHMVREVAPSWGAGRRLAATSMIV